MSSKALTALAVSKIKPPKSGRLERYDGMVPGFGVRVTDAGHKSWVYLYVSPVTRKRRRYTIAPVLATPGDLEAARSKALELRTMVRAGRDPMEEEGAARGQRIAELAGAASNAFRTVVELYDKRDLKGKRRGWEVKRIIDRELMPNWGDRPLASITRADVLERVEALVDAGKKAAANRLFEIIRRIFNWAYDRGTFGVDRSPCDRMKPPASKVIRQRILTEDEIRSLWGAFEKMGYPFGRLLAFALLTGQRRDEVAGISWAEVDLKAKLWIIPPERCKSDRPHAVPLSPAAVELLDALPRFNKGDYAFTTTDGERAVSGYSKAKARADELSGISDWRIHDLRRTVRTELSRLRTPEIVAERVINHAPRGPSKVYDQFTYLDEKREALEAWGARLRAIIEPPPENVVALPRAGQQGGRAGRAPAI